MKTHYAIIILLLLFTHTYSQTQVIIKPAMILVAGGTYDMGNDNYVNEIPIGRITIRSFYVGKYEVTQKEWKALMATNPSANYGCDNCPVERVSWDDVQKFITKLNRQTHARYRLPTEAEWEYAARGGKFDSGYIYSGSNNIADVAWCNTTGAVTHPVGQKKPNQLGIYDMSGNVWEWCADVFVIQCATDSGYKTTPKTLPCIQRGGSWATDSTSCRNSFRDYFDMYSGINEGGFRLALDVGD